MRDIKNKIKNGTEEIKKEIRQRTLGYILAAFGLVAGLAWNEAIKSFIEYLFPVSKNTFPVKFFLRPCTNPYSNISFYLPDKIIR